MWRALSLIVALSFFVSPGRAAAQQPCTTDSRRVVDELYRHILERSADPASAGMVQRLQDGRATVKDLVGELARSREHTQRFFRTEIGEARPYERAVSTIYRHLLGRNADEVGTRTYAEVAERRGAAAVINDILTSREYNETQGDYGVPGSGGLEFCAPGTGSTLASDTAAIDPRFARFDRDKDGVVTRDEWRGPMQVFRNRDWNNDGVLSGDELRVERGAVATSGQTIFVPANQAWVDTGIIVERGDMLTFNVDGSVQLSENQDDVATAAGSRSGRRAANSPVPQSTAGGLIARIGDAAPIYVGDRRTLRAPMNGRLYLGVNDDHHEDNRGEFRVTVSVR